MLHIIPNDLPTLTKGERSVLNKIKNLYKAQQSDAYLYIQPKIKNLIPDFILIDCLRGVSILEVKDWSIDYLASWTRLEIKNINGEKLDNPVFKAGQYYKSLEGLFSMDDRLYNTQGELDVKLSSFAILPHLKRAAFEENHLADVFNQKPAHYLLSEDFNGLEISDLFSEIKPLSPMYLKMLRAIIFPEIQILSTSENHTQELIAALDAEQERFAKNISYGHYMVTGVPGSGKTVMLLARAIHLIRENPDWKIRVLTYNRSLATKLEQKVKSLAENLSFLDIHIENIEISTFHKFALDIAHVSVPKLSGDEQQKWWDYDLPSLSLQKAKPKYDAILIDEYQDFLDDWIRLAIQSCKTFKTIDSKKEEKNNINLFLAGDRLQGLYRSTDTPWTEIDPILDMRGRSKLLKKAYRSANEHIDLALQFLSVDEKLKAEVEKFYCPMKEIEYENSVENGIGMIEGELEEVAIKIEELIYKAGYNPNEIMVLCKDWQRANTFIQTLPKVLQAKAESLNKKASTEHKIIVTTYQSAKGLEAPIVFLLDTDRFISTSVKEEALKYRKTMYVGITRASEQLYIHAENFHQESYAQEMKVLLQQTVPVQ